MSLVSERDTVLDIGSGRVPSMRLEARPSGVTYIGMDLSGEELAAAGPGVYDEAVVGDICVPVNALEGRVDLAVSWQVLEHVSSLQSAVDNIHAYLRPGGHFVALFSGSWAVFSLVNRMLPNRVGLPLVSKLNRREEMNRPAFPAHYDQCWHSALERAFGSWASVNITPLYHGATYFHFSEPLQRAYLVYENLLVKRGVRNLATHYLVTAEK